MKRSTLIGMGLVAVGSLLAAAGLAPTSLVAWTQVTTDINGGPTVVQVYELALYASPDSMAPPLKTIIRDSQAYTGTATKLLTDGQPDGRYWVRVRAQSKWGVWSEWSAPLEVIISTVPPVAPIGVKVK